MQPSTRHTGRAIRPGGRGLGVAPAAAAAAAAAACRRRPLRQPVSCAAGRKARPSRPARSRSGSSSGKGGRKGFGADAGAKQQEAWEGQILPCYRVYYKAGFKPPRFQGSMEVQRFEDGSAGLATTEAVTGAELLAVSHPLAFLEGTMGAAPAVEDLHVALLEAAPGPVINKILSYLPRKPAPAAAPAPAPAPARAPAAAAGDLEAAAAAAASGEPPVAPLGGEQQRPEQLQQQPQQQPLQQQQPAPPSVAHLIPAFWEQLGPGAYADAGALSSRALMRLLQASCWSEEFQDPAASQVRHERPAGFIGVWPELALLRHGCAPNTSAVVVDRFLLLHATADLEPGVELTFNKLGSAIAAPLAVRQAAHADLFGRPCRCRRCQLEEALPQEAVAQLAAVYDAAQGPWQERLQALLQGAEQAGDEETAEGLAELQAEVDGELSDLDEALAGHVPDKETRLLLLCGAYGGYDLAWQMEELLAEAPDLDKLANCVALLRLFAPGSEGHVYTSLLLDQAHTARAQELRAAAEGMARKTLATQRRLTGQISKLLAGAEMAAYAYAEAISCRYGLLPQEGLIPQLEQGLSLFYAGLSALSAAQGGDLDEAPEVTRSLMIDGIPVTVVDTVEAGAFAAAGGDGGGEGEGAAPLQAQVALGGRQQLKVQLLEDAAPQQQQLLLGREQEQEQQREQEQPRELATS